MNIILFGAPGAGKGTQAALIANEFSWQHVSTGDILRSAVASKSPLGVKVGSILDAGGLVDDELMFNLLRQRLSQPDCQNGFILDGFPRTLQQAKTLLTMGFDFSCVLYLEVEQEAIIQRLSNRRIHVASGRVYHTVYNPPKNEGLDDITHEPLIRRKDDYPERIRDRFQVFNESTFPVLDYLASQIEQKTIHSTGLAAEEIFLTIKEYLDLKNK
ncbi:MAG TPA: nucleoside monophosphate kinase [Gammaproteobacteria bacterium]|nr:nucleoside monophosphate kinase [Gammaproteobacteria bacterium]